MNTKNYYKDDLKTIREIKIHTLLRITNNGKRIAIRCPIHNEKSPSMIIYPDGSYYCFGCSKFGSNSIDFLMAVGLTFQESIEELRKLI